MSHLKTYILLLYLWFPIFASRFKLSTRLLCDINVIFYQHDILIVTTRKLLGVNQLHYESENINFTLELTKCAFLCFHRVRWRGWRVSQRADVDLLRARSPGLHNRPPTQHALPAGPLHSPQEIGSAHTRVPWPTWRAGSPCKRPSLANCVWICSNLMCMRATLTKP